METGTLLRSQGKSTNWLRKPNDITAVLWAIGISSAKRRAGTNTAEMDDGWELFYSGVELTPYAQAGVGILTCKPSDDKFC